MPQNWKNCWPTRMMKDVLNKLAEIKLHKKEEFKQFLYETQNILVDENSIFDVQVKRLHEYKRQQMNALYAIYKYLEIKKGNKTGNSDHGDFWRKSGTGVCDRQRYYSSDPVSAGTDRKMIRSVSPYFRVVMIENYNVSKAAKSDSGSKYF